MVTLLTRKSNIIFYILCGTICVLLVYMRQVPDVGYPEEHMYFDSNEKGAAITPYDLPVFIVTGEPVNQQPSTSQTSTSSLTLPNNVRCTADRDVCAKIKFVGNFSDADQRKYQALIIKQIKSIDALLGTDDKIRDTLYSITLDTSKGSRRGWAGSATIMIYLGNITSQEEFTEILTHELGHIVDLGILKGNRRVIQNAFYNIDHTFFSINDPSINFYTISRLSNNIRSESAGAMGFVGGYAMSDPFEDFAESFNMYLNHHHVFALLAASDSAMKKKYVYMQSLFKKRYLKADNATAIAWKNNTETRPWDTTKGY